MRYKTEIKSVIGAVIAVVMTLVSACQPQPELVDIGIDPQYRIARMQKLLLRPQYEGRGGYRWLLSGPGIESPELVSTSREYIFLTDTEGVYDITLEIVDNNDPVEYHFKVDVVHEELEYSPYISRVYEYRPAPGQFVNEMPRYSEGDTYEDMLRKVEECICDKNDIMISLGGYGGYVSFGFDHTVMNKDGYDFRIYGNAFYELINPEEKGGSAEPGIVYVAYDANMNGRPDPDEWYELAGSEYYKSQTKHNYRIAYRRPSVGHVPVPDEDNDFITDANYIPWTDSDGVSGFIAWNSFHRQEYYPLWTGDDELVFTGTRLAGNAVDISGDGTYFVLYSYPWGYADNHPNEYADLNSFDISWAVDADGNHVELPGIDFVKVMTGVNQYCGWIGETSTEISKACDLHLSTVSVPDDPIP